MPLLSVREKSRLLVYIHTYHGVVLSIQSSKLSAFPYRRGYFSIGVQRSAESSSWAGQHCLVYSWFCLGKRRLATSLVGMSSSIGLQEEEEEEDK